VSFDAAVFLAGLFDDGTALAALGPVPTPEAPAADAEPGPTPGEQAGPDLPPFPGWVLRPDAAGQLGWEAPDLPDERRTWARTDLVEVPAFPEKPRGPRPGIDPCCWCGRSVWWRSRLWPDVVRCGWCSPPAESGLVEWIGEPKSSGANPRG